MGRQKKKFGLYLNMFNMIYYEIQLQTTNFEMWSSSFYSKNISGQIGHWIKYVRFRYTRFQLDYLLTMLTWTVEKKLSWFAMKTTSWGKNHSYKRV